MKKTVLIGATFLFSLVLAISSMTWADKAHQEEGSSKKTTQPPKEEGSGSATDTKEYKDKKHSKEYPSDHKKEGSDAKTMDDQKAAHTDTDSDGKTSAQKREGS